MKVFILEKYDPIPKNVKWGHFIHNKGTNSAKKIYNAIFYTSRGDRVEIVINPSGYKAYEISFFVNNTMKQNDGKKPYGAEIINGVFSLLPKIVKKYDMETIYIESTRDEDEHRIIRNIDPIPIKKELLSLIDQFKKDVESGKISFYNDREKNIEMHLLLNVEKELMGINTPINLKEVKYDIVYKNTPYSKKVNSLFKEYINALESNEENGYKMPYNRRHVLYKKLLPKVLPDWDIKEDSGHISYYGFVLTKKSSHLSK